MNISVDNIENIAKNHSIRKFFAIILTILKWFVILCLSYVILYPLLYMISISFREVNEIIDPAVVWVPKKWTFDNIFRVISELKYFNSLTSTISISVFSTLLQLIPCSLAAYGMARFKFFGKNIMFIIVLFSILVPVQNIAISTFIQLKYFDFFGIGSLIGIFSGKPLTVSLYNSPFAAYIPALLGNGLRGGLYLFIFRQYFMGLPLDLEDAAYIDGCGPLKTLLKIILPISLAPFLVSFILSVIWYWNDAFVIPFLYPNSNTLAIVVDSIAARFSLSLDFHEIFMFQQVGCLLMIFPVLLLYLFLQKYFIEGIERTGFK